MKTTEHKQPCACGECADKRRQSALAAAKEQTEARRSEAACSASLTICPHCGHDKSTQPYGMNPKIRECGKCAGTWEVKYKSDRTEGRKSPANSVRLETLCTGCKRPMVCYWPPTTTFGGETCTAEEYMAKALQSESLGIYCDDCMERMPDVKLEDLLCE